MSGTTDEIREGRRDTRMRFEQWARNPACQANTISAVHGVRMSEVAEREGTKPTMGQSPFALARGNTFERSLFNDDATRLRQELEFHEVLPARSSGFVDLRLRINGGRRLRSIDDALRETGALFARIAASTSSAPDPTIIAGATIRIPGKIMLPEAILIIDVIAVRWHHDRSLPELVVGEVKTYPDRGGHTDGSELAAARAQAGVYVHGLDIFLAGFGLSTRLLVCREGFLVLSRPGFNQPSLRAGEDLRYQAIRAERGFQQLEKTAANLPPPGGKDLAAAVLNADTRYDSACLSFCDRASTCFSKALKKGEGIVLGEDVRRFLGSVTLPRAMELLDGSKARSETEEDLARRLGISHRQ